MFFHDKIREEGRSKQFSVKTELVDFVDQLSQSRYSPLFYLVFFRCLQGRVVEGLRAMVTMLGPHRMLSSSAGVHCRVGEVSPGPRLSGGQCWVSICRVWAGEFYPLTTTENCSV